MKKYLEKELSRLSGRILLVCWRVQLNNHGEIEELRARNVVMRRNGNAESTQCRDTEKTSAFGLEIKLKNSS